jgi:hypothetical protein
MKMEDAYGWCEGKGNVLLCSFKSVNIFIIIPFENIAHIFSLFFNLLIPKFWLSFESCVAILICSYWDARHLHI